MYYLSFIRNTHATKNNLEKAIAAYLATQNRQIISAQEREEFKISILAEIEKLNVKNKRCKKVEAKWRKGANWNKEDKDEYLDGVHFVSFVMYAANMKTPPAAPAEIQPETPPPPPPEPAKAPAILPPANRSPFDV